MNEMKLSEILIYIFAVIGFVVTLIYLANLILRVISYILHEIWKFIKDRYNFCYSIRHAFEQNEEIQDMSKYRCCGKCKRFKYRHDHFGSCSLIPGSGMHARLTADMDIYGNWNCDNYIYNHNWVVKYLSQ